MIAINGYEDGPPSRKPCQCGVCQTDEPDAFIIKLFVWNEITDHHLGCKCGECQEAIEQTTKQDVQEYHDCKIVQFSARIHQMIREYSTLSDYNGILDESAYLLQLKRLGDEVMNQIERDQISDVD